MKTKQKVSMLLGVALCSTPFMQLSNISLAQTEENSEYVEVPDYNLKRGFLEALNSLDGIHKVLTDDEIRNAKFTKEELARIKRFGPEVCVAHTSTECGVKVADLTGIEHCINLESLSLVNQRITDISRLQNLTKLKRIDLRNNEEKNQVITDISALRNLTELEFLNLNQAKLSNVDDLAKLTKLKTLTLMGTKISNIEGLRNLVELEHLDISLNNISSLEPLSNLTNLKVLMASNNSDTVVEKTKEKISDISSLKNLRKLTELELANHNIEDISVIKNFKNLTSLDLQNNKITNVEPTLVLPNLSLLWLAGNKDDLTNDIANFRQAREFFNKLNKENLTKAEQETIANLVASAPSVKNYFDYSTLEKLTNLSTDLNSKDSVENDTFSSLKLETLKGEVIEIKHHVGKQGYVGMGLEKLISKLPQTIDIVVKKEIPKEEATKTTGTLSVDEKGRDLLKVLILDEDGNIYKKPLNFKSSKNDTIYTSENGYLTISLDMMSVVQFVETSFTLDNNEFTTDKILRVAKTTPSKMQFINGKTFYDNDKEQIENELVVKLVKKENYGDTPAPPTPKPEPIPPKPEPINPEPVNPKEDTTKHNVKTGLIDQKIHFKVVDTKGNIVNGLQFSASDNEGFATVINSAQTEDGSYVFRSYMDDYDYNIALKSSDYRMVGSHGFTTNYKDYFQKVMLNGVKTDIRSLSEQDRESYFTIVVENINSEEEVTPVVPEPVIPNPNPINPDKDNTDNGDADKETPNPGIEEPEKPNPEPVTPEPNPISPDTNPVTPDTEEKEESVPATTKIGVYDRNVHFKVIDTKGNVVNGLEFLANDLDGFGSIIKASQDSDGSYTFRSQQEDYEYNITLKSSDYRLVNKHGFSTSYSPLFKKVVLGYDKADITSLSEQNSEKYFTIIVENLNEEPAPTPVVPNPTPVNPEKDSYDIINPDEEKTTPVVPNPEQPESVTPEPAPIVPDTKPITPEAGTNDKDETTKQEVKMGLHENKLHFKVVDKNGEIVNGLNFEATDEEGYGYKISAIQEEDGSYSFKSNGEEWDYAIALKSSDYKLSNKHKFTASYMKYFTKVYLGYDYVRLDNINEQDTEKYFTIVVEKNNSEDTATANGISTFLSLFMTRSAIEDNTITEPAESSTTTEELVTTTVGVKWDTTALKDEEGEYLLTGTLILPEEITNPQELTTTLKLKLKIKEQKVEYFGSILNEENKDILKIAIVDKDSNTLVTNSVILTDGTMSYSSNNGYIELPVNNGNNEITLISDKYTALNSVKYSGYMNKVYVLNDTLLREMSELGTTRKLVIKVQENKVKPTEEPDTTEQPNIKVIKDDNSNIEVELAEPTTEKLELVVKNVTADKLEKITTKLAIPNKKVLAKIFDIELLKDGVAVENNLTRTVKIPLPEEMYDKDIAVYFIDPKDSTLIKINSTLTEDKKAVMFTTTHFSEYAIVTVAEVAEKIDASTQTEPNNSSDTGTQTEPNNSNDSGPGTTNEENPTIDFSIPKDAPSDEKPNLVIDTNKDAPSYKKEDLIIDNDKNSPSYEKKDLLIDNDKETSNIDEKDNNAKIKNEDKSAEQKTLAKTGLTTTSYSLAGLSLLLAAAIIRKRKYNK